MNYTIPQCQHPQLLLNKAALNALGHGAKMFLDGHPSSLISTNNYNFPPSSTLIKIASSYTIEQLNNSYALYPNGFKDYLFIHVPCCHCSICLEKRRIELVWRASMESACYETPAYFFTLTYRNADLPPHGDLRYKDVQDFFKRLRIKFTRLGLHHNIRYLVAGEYGHNFGRPHYHVILWNNPLNANELDPPKHELLRSLVFSSWSHSDIQAFDFGQCAGGAARYCAKYIGKLDRHGHAIKPFVHASCGTGGLGFPLLSQLQNSLRANPHLSTLSFRQFDGTYAEVNYSRYTSSKIFPSPTSLVPAKYRTWYKELVDLLHIGCQQRILDIDYAEKFADDLRPSRSIIPNRFNRKLAFEYVPLRCHLKRLLYTHRLEKLLTEYVRLLHTYRDKVDYNLVSLYQLHKQLSYSETLPTAQRAVKARQNEVLLREKSKL